jgi:hypothetical protein
MAINKNHPFEEIDGVRCSVVESKVDERRMQFLKNLLELNGHTVKVVTVLPPAPKPAPPPAEGAAPEAPPAPPAPPPPPAYTVAVTDTTFNATNAIFGRQLKTKEGRIVTRAYWLQEEEVSDDETPYYIRRS